MVREFLRNSAIYIVASLLTRGMAFILLPFYARVFSVDAYGVIELVTVFGAVISLTVPLEISQGLARYLPETRTSLDKAIYTSTAWWFTVAAYGLFGVTAILLAAPISAWLLGSSEFSHVFRIAAMAMCAYGLFYTASNQLRADRRPMAYAVASLLWWSTSTLLTILLIIRTGLGLEAVFYGQLLGSLVAAGAAVYVARGSYRFTFAWPRWRQMMQFALPLLPSSVAVFAMTYMDRIVIRELMTVADVGLYAAAYRLAAVGSLIMVGFQGALMPLVLARHEEPTTPVDLANIFRYFVGLSCIGVVVVALFAKEIVTLLLTAAYQPAAVLLPLLAPAVMLSGMYVFAPGLIIAKRPALITIVNVLVATGNVALNMLWIPHWGLTGAGAAALTSGAAGFAVLMAMSQKTYPVPHEWHRLALGIGVAGTAILFGVLAAQSLSGHPEEVWGTLIRAGMALCASFTLARLFFGKDALRAGLRGARLIGISGLPRSTA
jgi:O-antigen/teichoic acid export membrane protein